MKTPDEEKAFMAGWNAALEQIELLAEGWQALSQYNVTEVGVTQRDCADELLARIKELRQ